MAVERCKIIIVEPSCSALLYYYTTISLFPCGTVLQSKSSGRVNRANQRKLASLFSAGDVSSDLAKYNQLKVCVLMYTLHILPVVYAALVEL